MKLVELIGSKGVNFLRPVFFLASVTLASSAFAEVNETYDSVEALMSAHQDYDPSNNMLEMLDADKPHYRLSKIVLKNDLEEVVYYENWRAAVYGIYNVFAHTPLDQVTVTATPLQADSLMNMNQTTLLEDQSVTLEMSREEAYDVLSGLINIDSLSDVKVVTEYGHQWSDDFNNVYYEDQQPGLDALISELSLYCVHNCK